MAPVSAYVVICRHNCTDVHTYASAWITCEHKCVHMCTSDYKHACGKTNVCVFMDMPIHPPTPISVYKYVCRCRCTYVDIHICV